MPMVQSLSIALKHVGIVPLLLETSACQFEICGRFDFHFEAVLTWGRFDWKSSRTTRQALVSSNNGTIPTCFKAIRRD
jgi:hypothetical protein